MTPHMTLTEDLFRRLLAGEKVEMPGFGTAMCELVLADIGYARMEELIGLAAGWPLYEPDVDQFITISRPTGTANGAGHGAGDGGWLAGCVDHAWSTRGTMRQVGETLGTHLREKHPAERLEDFADVFLGALYALRFLHMTADDHERSPRANDHTDETRDTQA